MCYRRAYVWKKRLCEWDLIELVEELPFHTRHCVVGFSFVEAAVTLMRTSKGGAASLAMMS